MTSQGKNDNANSGRDHAGLGLRRRERHGDRVKVIAMPDTWLSVDAEFDRVLSKPFSIDALCAAIDALTIGTNPVMH
ncbi:MAG TPA: hypothetical protein VKM55_29545 [Candidatus Lokiarchaeia archaeon]|nr:hypothetical protein [Candidatus Lokiarchaeia archaeon]